MKKITTENCCIQSDQFWINKAINDGYMNFLPVHKFPNKSIGEHIAIKYNQLYKEEFDRYFHNGIIEEFYHLLPERSPKITFENSVLVKNLLMSTFLEQSLSQKEALSDYKKSLEFIKSFLLLYQGAVTQDSLDYQETSKDNSFELSIDVPCLMRIKK